MNRFLIQGWEATNLRSPPFLAAHESERGQARSCGEAGGMAMVQLPALRNGEDGHGGDRVGMDCPTTGSNQIVGEGIVVNPTLRKVREGWGTLSVLAWVSSQQNGRVGHPPRAEVRKPVITAESNEMHAAGLLVTNKALRHADILHPRSQNRDLGHPRFFVVLKFRDLGHPPPEQPNPNAFPRP